jgi:P27 family predicted phage terminase small subunit
MPNNKKPTNLKIIEGNRGKRPLPNNEPHPQPIAPKCPDFIDDEAKAEWERLAPLLEELGLLTQIDGDMLGAYCQTLVDYKNAIKFTNEKGYTYKAGETIRPYPQVIIAREALKRLQALAREFGMTPSARASISVSKSEEDNSWIDKSREELLKEYGVKKDKQGGGK